jgi:hypothetical protein
MLRADSHENRSAPLGDARAMDGIAAIREGIAPNSTEKNQ